MMTKIKKVAKFLVFLLAIGLMGGLENDEPITWFNGIALILCFVLMFFWFVLPDLRKNKEDKEREAMRLHVNK